MVALINRSLYFTYVNIKDWQIVDRISTFLEYPYSGQPMIGVLITYMAEIKIAAVIVMSPDAAMIYPKYKNKVNSKYEEFNIWLLLFVDAKER